MRLSPATRMLVSLATIAPLAGIFFAGAFMALVVIGLWDHAARHLPIRTLEPIGWSGALALGMVFASLRVVLVPFYIAHIIRNGSASFLVRIAFAFGVFIVPLAATVAYCALYILPDEPPLWARKVGHALRDLG